MGKGKGGSSTVFYLEIWGGGGGGGGGGGAGGAVGKECVKEIRGERERLSIKNCT